MNGHVRDRRGWTGFRILARDCGGFGSVPIDDFWQPSPSPTMPTLP